MFMARIFVEEMAAACAELPNENALTPGSNRDASAINTQHLLDVLFLFGDANGSVVSPGMTTVVDAANHAMFQDLEDTSDWEGHVGMQSVIVPLILSELRRRDSPELRTILALRRQQHE